MLNGGKKAAHISNIRNAGETEKRIFPKNHESGDHQMTSGGIQATCDQLG